MAVTLINNLECNEPRITIKRDIALREHSEDKEIALEDVEKEIQARNINSSTPIFINYEYKWCWNMCFIDTPGLGESSEDVIRLAHRKG